MCSLISDRDTGTESSCSLPEAGADVVALDDALQTLEAIHPRKSRVVEFRFFGGLSIEETGEALQVSPDTVKRDWRFAKLWLLRELRGERVMA